MSSIILTVIAKNEAIANYTESFASRCFDGAQHDWAVNQ
jgi:hypothetical protein